MLRNLSSRSPGSDFSTVKVSERSDMSYNHFEPEGALPSYPRAAVFIRGCSCSSDLAFGFTLGSLVRSILPRKKEQQSDAHTDGAVRDVERRKARDLPVPSFHVEVEKVDHVSPGRHQS